MTSRTVGIYETAVRRLDGARAIWIVFGVFVTIRVVLAFGLPVEPTSDALWYFNRAAGIAAGEGYSEDGVPTAFWPVGWPGALGLWFSLVGTSVSAGKLLNLFAACASFFLTFRLSRMITRSRRVAVLSVLVLSVYLNNAAYTGLLLSETWVTFLLLAACWIYLELRTAWGAIGAGLSAGLAVLTKSQLLLFMPLLVLFDFLADRKVKGALVRSLILGVGMAVVLLPWAYRNYTVFDTFVPVSTNSGLTLLTGNNGSASGTYTTGDPLVQEVLAKRTVANQLEIDRASRALAWEWIAENPWRFVKLFPAKAWYLWGVDGEAAWEFEHGYAKFDEYRSLFLLGRLVNQAIYGAILLGFAIGLVRFLLSKWKRSDLQPSPSHLFWLVPAFLVVTTLVTLVFSGQPRFHYPVMPFIIIVAGWGILAKGSSVAEGKAQTRN